MKKIVVLFVFIFLITLTSVTVASSTVAFSDVPMNHWSYQAMNVLVKAGIVDGYKSGSLQRDKVLSRYEMSQWVAKAMNNSAKATPAQKALIDKLASEFALELNNIATPQEQPTKHYPDFSFTGRYMYQYKITHYPNSSTTTASSDFLRLNGSVAVDEDTTFNFRLTNYGPTNTNFKDTTSRNYGDASTYTEFDRYWITTKVGVVNTSVGHIPFVWNDNIVDSSFFSYDGLQLNWNANGINYDLKHGRFARNVSGYAWDNHSAADMSNIDIDSFRIDGKHNKFDWGAGFIRFYNNKANDHTLASYAEARVGWLIQDNLYVSWDAMRNTHATSGGNFWIGKLVYGDQVLDQQGKSNWTIDYMQSQRNGAFNTFCAIDAPDWGLSDAWKNHDIAYRYALKKNLVARIQRGFTTDIDNSAENYDMWRFQLFYTF
jgi:hypothetical protein